MKKTAKHELRDRSVSELKTAAESFQRDLFSMRLHAAGNPSKDTSRYKKMRKDIARALTYLREKQGRA